jgi:hypothetical protein
MYTTASYDITKFFPSQSRMLTEYLPSEDSGDTRMCADETLHSEANNSATHQIKRFFCFNLCVLPDPK